MSDHPSHTEQTPRLNRAIGQLEGIKRMIGERQYCVDILTQLRAVRSAIKTIELGVLETHMKSCLTKSCECGDETVRDTQIAEIMQLLKKYE
ncbi:MULTISPECIES: metal-sensitive transcriptional regulator [Asticcacaulis]|uniref:metal-sensitive transcriptional regulator n=1 Tax=Asticcacaulis TaxID=76890 RepID=UPI001AEA255D|nr:MULTISPECIES: metal-sensitive transcriptional regulator [Asticcacaulis]MBP2159031.1 DNA-binding FrmR family transcriptional regulator [Asticcacaulis solisilvae]MDR6800076.1 DNA-binding FrmR family transcriptional regulator [Asticcacaulis sp. BE141]